jgi:hypothetical protein
MVKWSRQEAVRAKAMFAGAEKPVAAGKEVH